MVWRNELSKFEQLIGYLFMFTSKVSRVVNNFLFVCSATCANQTGGERPGQ